MTLFRFFLLLLLFFPTFSTFAQAWQLIAQVGDVGNESISGMETYNEAVYFCGQFNDDFLLGDVELIPDGRDVFFCKLEENGTVDWVIQGSSPGDDLSTEMTIDGAGNSYWIGSYWFEADFADFHLEAQKSAKSDFIIKINPLGMVEWGHSLDGTGTKNIFDITTDDNQNIYLTGNFTDSLFFQDTFLVAADVKDLFVLKLNAEGDMTWISSIPSVGYFIPNRIVVNNFEEVTIAGNFKGESTIGSDFIKTNTNDDDIFVAHFNESGMPLWGRRAGGVFEQTGTSLALDNVGDIYVGGFFVGVITVSDDIQIQSPNNLSQVVLLKYLADGTPVWARSLGGFDEEFLDELIIKNQQLFATGYYRGTLEFDVITSPGEPNDYTAYAAGFDLTGQTQWVKAMYSDNFIFGEQIAATNNGDIICGGSFNGEATFDDESITSNGFFDIYLTALKEVFTNTGETIKSAELFTIYPNPAQDDLFIESEYDDFILQIFNVAGQEVYTAKNKKRINIAALPDGIYLMKLQGEEGNIRQQELIKHTE